MAGSAMMWIVFAVSLVGCAPTLGFVFIKPKDFEFLLGAEAALAAAKAKPAVAAPQSVDEKADAILAEGEEEGEDEAEASGEEEPEVKAEESTFKESILKMMAFLESCLASLATKNFKFDSFNKFGCHLFLAGAAEAASRKGNLSHDQFVEMLGRSVGVLGGTADLAKKFSEKYEEYLLEPKYAEMFRSGGDAMERYLDGSSKDVAAAMSEALQQWNKPAQASGKEKLVTVMFTDLVGSTKMTQELGDAGAQEVVRKHNEVVCNALRRYNGIEVKHTGDGIMARFGIPSDGVEAGLAMQAAFVEHNQANPARAVNVRIGLNAGEPIQEEGDIFGVTVQLAARICDKSKSGHVMVSNIVRELCQGRKVRFDDAGPFELKGIQGPVHLYFAHPT